MPPNSARPGSSCASSAWPPSRALALVERDVVAALGRDRGGLQAGRAAAGDHDLLPARGLGLVAVDSSRPVSGCWMQEIGRPSWKWPMQAWLQPMQARMSSVGPALALFGHLGIADHRPRHAAHVGRAFGDDALGVLRLVDAAGDEDRGSRRLLQLAPHRARDRHGRSPSAARCGPRPPKRADVPAMTLR